MAAITQSPSESFKYIGHDGTFVTHETSAGGLGKAVDGLAR
jgi:hypothetical protein